MKYDTLKALVNAKVYENTEQRITGGDMNTVLQSAIASLGAHYQMGGLVSPADQITVGDEPVVFLATTPGTYTYFGGIVVADGEVALLVWSGTAWSKQTPDIATGTEVSQLGQNVNDLDQLLNGITESVLSGNPLNGSFYRADLSTGSAARFVCKKIDISDCIQLKIYASLLGIAAISLTDENDTILYQVVVGTIPADEFEIVLANYPGAKFLYFTNDISALPGGYVKGAKKTTLDYSEVLDACKPVEREIPVSWIAYSFYRNDLTIGSFVEMQRALIILDAENESIILDVVPYLAGWCSLTDVNDNILWQSNEAGVFPKKIDFADYPTAAKLYLSNHITEQATPKVYYSNPLSFTFEKIDGEIEKIDRNLDLVNANATKPNLSNSFVPGNIISLPTEFGSFRIPFQVSRTNKIYGWDICPERMQKNVVDKESTFFVSVNGNDQNNGLTPATAFRTLDTAIAQTDVNTIILLSGEYVSGVNFSANININKEINIVGIGNVVLKNKSAEYSITVTAPVFVQNITFDGGYYALKCQLHDELCVFDKCRFYNSSVGDGFRAFGGTFIMNECEASSNAEDGFNYFINSDGGVNYGVHTLEIKCYGFFNGLDKSLYQYNGSTSHSGCKIIRIYCKYGISRGTPVGDADCCLSINYGVESFTTQNLDGTNERRACYGSQGNNSGTRMWLYDCSAFGSKYDVIIDTNCWIYSTIDYGRKLNNGNFVLINP